MSMAKQRRGIAMIELIFALVIMGIVLMSAPMLIQQSIRSGSVALQQEAIAAAASQTAIVLSMHWDENNNSNTVGATPMMDTNRVPFDFNTSNPPVGLQNISGRLSTDSGKTLPATALIDFGMDETITPNDNESDYTDFDDVDDYQGSNFGLMVFSNENTTADIGDYVDVYLTMSTTINYAEDRPRGGLLNSSNIIINPLGAVSRINSSSPAGNPITNIKFIRVNLTSASGVAELEKNITLEAFSCNIGTTLPEGETEL